MHCCVTDLRDKKVINSKNACVIGNVWDVEIDTCTGKVVSITVMRRNMPFAFFCKDEGLRICWDEIDVIGDEAILVCSDAQPTERPPKKKKCFLDGLFR